VNSIQLNNISKKYGTQLIFSGITKNISGPASIAITGYNGSGKSTLLQMIAGYITPSSGTIKYRSGEKEIPADEIYRQISFSAPYLDLVEEFTAEETAEFYKRFKPVGKNVSTGEILETAMLAESSGKQVKFFSSGMKQRLKLTLALMSDVPFIFLDEPASNLDRPGIEWFRNLVKRFSANKTLVISSNDSKDEIDFCNEIIKIGDYKNI